MRAFVVLAVISSAFAAPANDGLQFLQRTKKSPSPYGGGVYGGGGYGGCSGGSHIASPVALYLTPGSPHYREDEAEQHEAMFDHQHHHHHLEHAEHARSYYEPAAAASLVGLPALAAASSPGPILAPAPSGASAVFPGARVGNCGVPLLLSCAPNVISGHLSHSSSYGAPAYRSNEHISKKEVMEQAASEQALHVNSKHASWANEEGDSLKEDKPHELQAKWSGNQQAKSWESERAAAPLDAPSPNKQASAQSPQHVHDAPVENLHV